MNENYEKHQNQSNEQTQPKEDQWSICQEIAGAESIPFLHVEAPKAN